MDNSSNASEFTKPGGEAVFKTWIKPLSLDEFFHEVWAKKHLVLPNPTNDNFAGILTAEEIEEFLSSQVLPAHLIKLVRNGRPIAVDQWAELDVRRNVSGLLCADTEKVQRFFGDGASITIGVSEKNFSGIDRCVSALENYFGFQIQANIYLTPPSAQALTRHYDFHDVLVMQITGSKLWEIHDKVIETPSPLQGPITALPDNSTVVEQVNLQAGQMLYLPRGVIHEVKTTREVSAHITFGLHQPLMNDVIKKIADMSVSETRYRLRQPLPNADNSEKKAFLQAMHNLFSELDFETVFSSRDKKKEQRSFKIKSVSLTAETWLCRADKVEFELKKEGGKFILKTFESMLEVPSLLKPTIQDVLSGKPFIVANMPGILSNDAKIKLATDIFRMGLLDKCNPEL